MSLYEVGSYKVELISDEQRASEDVDTNGTTALLDAPLNYEIINTETERVEVRSSFLAAAIQVAFDLDSKLITIREQTRPAAQLGIVT